MKQRNNQNTKSDVNTSADSNITSKSNNNNNDSSKNGNENGVQLRREIGLLEGIAITFGAIVGSGIFISPRGIIGSAGSVGLSLAVWIGSGLISLIGAICYTELGTSLPSSGGDYNYLKVAFGPIPAFLFIWGAVMIFIPCNIAILAISSAQYIFQSFFSIECQIPTTGVRLLSAAIIIFLLAVNCWNVRVATKMQSFFMFIKLTCLGIIIVIGIINLSYGKLENFEKPFDNTNWSASSITLAFYSGIFAFGGSNVLTCMTEEIKNPTKTLPRSIFTAFAMVVAVYTLTNIAYFTVLTPGEILNSDAVAVSFGEKTVGTGFAWIITVLVSLSLVGGLSVAILPSSRMLYAGARNGHFPKFLSYVQIDYFTPLPAVIFLGLLSLVYLSSSNVYALINYSGFTFNIANIGISFSVLYLRWKFPELERPIKVNSLFPILYFLISLTLFVLPVYAAPIEAGIGCGLLLSGIPVYYLFVNHQEDEEERSNCTKWLGKITDKITQYTQKLFLVVPEEVK